MQRVGPARCSRFRRVQPSQVPAPVLRCGRHHLRPVGHQPPERARRVDAAGEAAAHSDDRDRLVHRLARRPGRGRCRGRLLGQERRDVLRGRAVEGKRRGQPRAQRVGEPVPQSDREQRVETDVGEGASGRDVRAEQLGGLGADHVDQVDRRRLLFGCGLGRHAAERVGRQVHQGAAAGERVPVDVRARSMGVPHRGQELVRARAGPVARAEHGDARSGAVDDLPGVRRDHGVVAQLDQHAVTRSGHGTNGVLEVEGVAQTGVPVLGGHPGRVGSAPQRARVERSAGGARPDPCQQAGHPLTNPFDVR